MKLFLSYSYNEHHKISQVLEKIKNKIPEFKDAVIWDPSINLKAGDDFRAEIKKQILASDVYVLLWTKSAADSPWVLYEAGMADASGKPIVIAVEPSSPKIFDVFSKYQIVELGK
ncbi:MAG: TIR domain-containing protein [Methyloprofundus sp.]|nr:TIR domain-containing protein [Methyloprofundus sp.]